MVGNNQQTIIAVTNYSFSSIRNDEIKSYNKIINISNEDKYNDKIIIRKLNNNDLCIYIIICKVKH